MSTGKLVKKFAKGFGFVVADDEDGQEIFVHARACGTPQNWEKLKINDKLQFDVVRCVKGLECAHVRLVDEEIEDAV